MVRKIELLILAGLLIIVAIFSLNWALKGAIHHQKDVLVPDLVGKHVIEAFQILSEQNLGLKKEGAEYNETIPAGTILRQQPAAGISVREGKIIRVTISQGGESVYVPDLIGVSLRSAEITLRSRFLALGEVRTQSSIKFEKETIISQGPPAGTITQKNSFVHLTVSNGPPTDGTILMPDFVGKNWSAVQSWSKETEIKTEMTEDAFSSAEPETVLQQEIAPDTPLQKGQTIKFTISSKTSSPSQTTATPSRKFYYEVPQGESAKQYIFVLVDASGSREIFRGYLEPGSKKNIPLPPTTTSSARVRIFVNGILTEERNVQ